MAHHTAIMAGSDYALPFLEGIKLFKWASGEGQVSNSATPFLLPLVSGWAYGRVDSC